MLCLILPTWSLSTAQMAIEWPRRTLNSCLLALQSEPYVLQAVVVLDGWMGWQALCMPQNWQGCYKTRVVPIPTLHISLSATCHVQGLLVSSTEVWKKVTPRFPPRSWHVASHMESSHVAWKSYGDPRRQTKPLQGHSYHSGNTSCKKLGLSWAVTHK